MAGKLPVSDPSVAVAGYSHVNVVSQLGDGSEGSRNPSIGGGSAAMNELRVTVKGVTHEFHPEEVVRIGRSSDNSIVIDDPTVSRHHAQLSWGPSGWLFNAVGKAPTFLASKPVDRLTVDGPIELTLASSRGPAIRVNPAGAPFRDHQIVTNAPSQAHHTILSIRPLERGAES